MPFSNVLPIIDVRLSASNYINDAIGIALSIAECSSFGKRMIAMGNNPTWIQLPDDGDFINEVKHIHTYVNESPISNIELTIELIIQSFLQSKMTESEIEKVCIVLLSTMDFGDAIHDRIKRMFSMNGIQNKMPHIVYWGLHVNNNTPIPCAFNEPRTTLISGGSSAGFDFLRNMSFSHGREMNPYISLRNILKQNRYVL
jgi:hypothetical protein